MWSSASSTRPPIVVRVGNNIFVQDAADGVKSLVSLSSVVHVLGGVCSLLDLLEYENESLRRAVIVHFPAYDMRRADDVKEFKDILHTFREQIPVEKKPNLVKGWKYLFAGSAGCIGILKDWLLRALILSDGKELTRQNLADSAEDEEALAGLVDRIEERKRRFVGSSANFLRIEELLETGGQHKAFRQKRMALRSGLYRQDEASTLPPIGRQE